MKRWDNWGYMLGDFCLVALVVFAIANFMLGMGFLSYVIGALFFLILQWILYYIIGRRIQEKMFRERQELMNKKFREMQRKLQKHNEELYKDTGKNLKRKNLKNKKKV